MLCGTAESSGTGEAGASDGQSGNGDDVAVPAGLYLHHHNTGLPPRFIAALRQAGHVYCRLPMINIPWRRDDETE